MADIFPACQAKGERYVRRIKIKYCRRRGPNIPLRGFLYFADLYKKYIRNTDLSIRKKIMIPTPHYIVFYNGQEQKEEIFQQRLSDSFEDDSEGCIELTVQTININYGYNQKLMSRCSTLAEYSYFIAEIRKNLESMVMKEAVETAIDKCIQKNILKEFLLEQKAEVIAMSIYEYNEEYVKKTLYEDGMEAGYDQGKQVTLVKSVEAVMQNFHVGLQKACEGIGITVEEYERAKVKKS